MPAEEQQKPPQDLRGFLREAMHGKKVQENISKIEQYVRDLEAKLAELAAESITKGAGILHKYDSAVLDLLRGGMEFADLRLHYGVQQHKETRMPMLKIQCSVDADKIMKPPLLSVIRASAGYLSPLAAESIKAAEQKWNASVRSVFPQEREGRLYSTWMTLREAMHLRVEMLNALDRLKKSLPSLPLGPNE